MRLSPGRWLNAQMHLLSWLGEELHGESFLAEQRPQGRSVVVKVMSSDACRTPAYVERFRRCAERAMLLNHRHAAAVYAYGVLPAGDAPDAKSPALGISIHPPTAGSQSGPATGIPWLATDPLDGPDLRTLLSEGTTAETLSTLLTPVADLLDRAGALGLIHGELSPANLVQVSDGATARLVLVDLGLAKVQATDLLELPAAPGALCYRSPEQCADGHHAEAASDRYALAIMLYEAVAGRPPFVADNPRALMQLHRSAPVPPLRTLAPRVQHAGALDAFFVRALAKEPAARFASAMAMLEEFTVALTVPQKANVRPAQRRRSPRWYRLLRDDDHRTSIDVVVGPRALLGKQSECDVVCQAMPSPEQDLITGTISREHAVLIWLDNRLSILDQSSNGTFINDRRVGPRLTALPDGTQLRLGQHLIVQVTQLSPQGMTIATVAPDAESGPGEANAAGTARAVDVAGVILTRQDAYAAGVPPTLMLWQQIALPGSPLSRLGGAMRWGQVWVANRELWWSGHPTVAWQRQDHSNVLGPAPLRDGDTLVERDVTLRVVH